MNDKAVDELKALGDLYAQQKKTGQAAAMYKNTWPRSRATCALRKRFAESEYAQKNYDEAIKYLPWSRPRCTE